MKFETHEFNIMIVGRLVEGLLITLVKEVSIREFPFWKFAYLLPSFGLGTYLDRLEQVTPTIEKLGLRSQNIERLSR